MGKATQFMKLRDVPSTVMKTSLSDRGREGFAGPEPNTFLSWFSPLQIVLINLETPRRDFKAPLELLDTSVLVFRSKTFSTSIDVEAKKLSIGGLSEKDNRRCRLFTFSLIRLIDWYWETSEAARPTVNPSTSMACKTFNAINQFDS